MDYEDFLLHLGIDASGITVRVARSPAGESDPESLTLTWSEEKIATLATAFAKSAEMKRQGRDLIQAEIAEPCIAEVGRELFRALFPEVVRNRYEQSLGRVAERGRGLRIRIEMGLGINGVATFHAIPWEYLARDDHFLALSREISIVRYLAIGLPNDRTPVPAPLSILVLPGESLSAGELDLAKEHRQLEQAWSESGNVRIHILSECTLDGLREELLARDYHALHFMGHGTFSSHTGEGRLAFTTAQGSRIWVNGADLAEQLRDRSSLRLVFLNACRTAQASTEAPYTGVATALLRAGIPAVIAMQFPISDSAAIAFSRTFYRRIARGDTVDAAVTEGRMAIRRLTPESAEWGIPVLFERLTSGRLVKAEDASVSRLRFWKLSRNAVGVSILGAMLAFAWYKPFWKQRAPATGQRQSDESRSNALVGEPALQKTCSTFHNSFSEKDHWWDTGHGSAYGIIDSAFKMVISRPNFGDKRCVDCKIQATSYSMSATAWADGKPASWGLYFLDMSDIQGIWFSFELDGKGRAFIRQYHVDTSIATLWSGFYLPREKSRLTIEVGNGIITGSVDGKKIAHALYNQESVPKVALGSGFFLATGSDVPATAWFDDYELTSCVISE